MNKQVTDLLNKKQNCENDIKLMQKQISTLKQDLSCINRELATTCSHEDSRTGSVYDGHTSCRYKVCNTCFTEEWY